MISLDITSPAEDASLPITAAPAMPGLDARVTAAGYQGVTSAVAFGWKLIVLGNTVHAAVVGKKKVGVWHGYSQTAATGTTTGTTKPWRPGYALVVGGFGRLVVTATLPNVLDNPVTSDPRWINIAGTDPPERAAEDFIRTRIQPRYYDTYHHIICHESRWQQFSGRAQGPEGYWRSRQPDTQPRPGTAPIRAAERDRDRPAGSGFPGLTG